MGVDKALESKQGEMNDKRMYARHRCEELLCPDHPFSINPAGTEETVAALAAWVKCNHAELRPFRFLPVRAGVV